MEVYSKTGKVWAQNPKYQKVLTLNNVDLTKDNVVYYHHPYDELIEGVLLSKCLNKENWSHIRNNPSVTLVHDNDSETFDKSFALDLIETIQTHNINSTQITIIVMDENHKVFLETYIKNAGLSKVNILVNNYLLNEISIVKKNIQPIKRFSSLSRNYRVWRLRFYVELLQRNLLDTNFLYSFFNIWPYDQPPKVYSSKELINDLQQLDNVSLTKNTKKWIKKCPHKLEIDNNVGNKWSNATYNAVMLSNIHVVIETHYDQKEFAHEKTYDRLFAPSSITEKAYKPIACKRPFIAFSTPYWLEDLRNLGFKTFHPFINEDYDLVENNLDRLNMIVNEIERISKLNSIEFNQLNESCQSIVDYNYNILLEKKNAQ